MVIIFQARDSIENNRIEDIVDANLLVQGCNMGLMLKIGQLALRCVVKEPKERPTMNQVWRELEAALRSVDEPLAEEDRPMLAREESIVSRRIDRSLTSGDDYCHSIVSVDGIGLERFYVDVDGVSFQSASLRCLSISVDEDFSIPR